MNLTFLKNSVVMISGATGMIGSQMIKEIIKYNKKAEANIRVVALYRNEEKRKIVFHDELESPEIRWHCCDICKPVQWKENIDYIIHTAGVTGGSKQHIDYPMRTISTAIYGTVNLLDLAKTKNIKGFVYLSSLEIYGKTDFSIPSIHENEGGYIDPTLVRSSYSESKRICETICSAYAKQYGVPAKIVRLTATYGRGGYYTDKRVLCEFARCIIEKKDIILKSSGDTVRNYCDVSDAISAILTVLEKGNIGEAYNVANMKICASIRELAEHFVFLYPNTGISVIFDIADDITSLGYNDTIKTALDTSKLEDLGWKANVGLDEMIHNLVESMQHSCFGKKGIEDEKI